jgi:pimeloyl-ACP methyl ester carboxylesterase
MELRCVEANGLRFAYFEEGEGPLVLMLHGFPDTAHTWDLVRPRIAAKGYRVVTPFMRGYHPTAIPACDPDQETLGKDALALIGALGEKSAVLVGHDWGASAAYSAATLEPSRVDKLFVVAIPHPATVRVTLALLEGIRHFLLYKLPGAPARFARADFRALRALYKRWSPTWDPPDDELAPTRECFANRASLNAAFGYYRKLSFSVPKYMRRPILVPTVAFAGLDDPAVTLEDYRRAAKTFPRGYVVEEIRGGHFLHREDPESFATKLLRHL